MTDGKIVVTIGETETGIGTETAEIRETERGSGEIETEEDTRGIVTVTVVLELTLSVTP